MVGASHRSQAPWAVVTAIVALSFVSACSLFGLSGQNRPEVSAAILAWTHDAKAGDTLDFRDVAEFEWDQMAVFNDYTTNQTAREILGFDWNVEDGPKLGQADLLGFALNRRIVAWTVMAPGFKITLEGDGFTMPREHAEFVWDGAAFELPPSGSV